MKTNQSRLQRYQKIALGSTALIAPSASAAVIVHQPAGGPATTTIGTSIAWDMTSDNYLIGGYNDATYEFQLSNHGDIHWGYEATSAILSTGAQATNLSAGYSVSSASNTWAPGTGYAYVTTSFAAPARGFVGVHFDIGGNTHYGWADIERDGAGNHTLHAWAYEDQANTAITTAAVPEPSSISLLALGATGLLARRRRKAA